MTLELWLSGKAGANDGIQLLSICIREAQSFANLKLS